MDDLYNIEYSMIHPDPLNSWALQELCAMKQSVSEKMIRVFSGKHLMCQKKNILRSLVSQDTVTNITNFIVATLLTRVAVSEKICCLIFQLGS